MTYLARSFFLALALGFTNAPYAQTQPEPDHHYLYRGTRIPLILDDARVAIRVQATESPSDIGELVAEIGLQLVGIDMLPADGWQLVRLAPESGSPAKRVAQLAQADAIPFASPVFLGPAESWLVPTEVVLVRLHDESEAAMADFAARHTSRGSRLSLHPGTSALSGVLALRCSSASGFDALALANDLAADPDVRWAEPDALFRGAGALTPTDPYFADQWAHNNVGAFGGLPGLDMDTDLAWDLETGSQNVPIAILDVGIDLAHEDLDVISSFDTTYDFGDGGAFNACDNHATFVAGCAAAKLNSIGIVGTAPDCPLISVRNLISELNCSGFWITSPSWVSAGITGAATSGARVTVNSNSYPFQFSFIDDAYETTRDGGVVHFASTGNNGANSINYPGSIESVNAIGALDAAGPIASFSNKGNGIFAVGPGNNIWTTDRTGTLGSSFDDYYLTAGTSVSTPLVAGIAALMLSKNPYLSADDVEQALADSALDLGPAGFDTTFGWGLPNAKLALELTPDPVGLSITSTQPSVLTSFNSPSATVTVSGDGLAGVTGATLNGNSLAFSAINNSELEVYVQNVAVLGPAELNLTDGIGSASASIDIVSPTDPQLDIVGNPLSLFSFIGFDLTLAGPVDSALIIAYSWSPAPSVLPGFIDLAIGNNFSALYIYDILPIPSPGWFQHHVDVPGVVSPGLTFYLQAILADDSSLPIPTSLATTAKFAF